MRLMYRHGLRVAEVSRVRWAHIDVPTALLHVRRLKQGVSSVHPLHGPELRALRRLQNAYPGEGRCVPLRARCPTDLAGDSSHYQPGRHHCRLTLSGPSAYVTARLRILPGAQAYGYARHPTVSGASQHPTHRPVYRTRAPAGSRLLGRLTIASQSCLAAAAPNDSFAIFRPSQGE